jgi:hypothetical protein
MKFQVPKPNRETYALGLLPSKKVSKDETGTEA